MVVCSSNISIFSDGGSRGASTHYYYKIFAYDTNFNYASGVEISGGGSKADHDGDGLIELYTAEMLNNMRHDLAGTSYKSSARATGNVDGCPNNMCNGYELTAHIDLLSLLDTNGNWSIDMKDEAVGGKTHEVIDTNQDTSWMPIGDISAPFTGTFEGNNHTIANLWVNISSSQNNVYAGLFGVIGGTSVEIRNVGIILGSIYASSSDSISASGGLVGSSSSSLKIENSYFSGAGGVSSFSSSSRLSDSNSASGGLVGSSSSSSSSLKIENSYFSGVGGVSSSSSSSFSDSSSASGGLVGSSSYSTITNSYFSGADGVSSSSDSSSFLLFFFCFFFWRSGGFFFLFDDNK